MTPVGLHRHLETWAVVQLPLSIAAPFPNSVLFLPVPVPGVRVGDLVWFFAPAIAPGVAFMQAVVTGPDLVEVTVLSLDAPGSLGEQVYTVLWMRTSQVPVATVEGMA